LLGSFLVETIPCSCGLSVGTSHPDQQDVGENQFKILRDSRSLYTKDIQGKRTRSVTPGNRSLDVSDIEGARPIRLERKLIQHSPSLRTKDIEGAEVKPMHELTKRANSSQTSFIHPCYIPGSVDPPKFLRDTLTVTDIEGARQRNFYSKLHPHDRTNRIEDLPGSSPKSHYKVCCRLT